MSKFSRVQQWNTFARQWLLYDAKWQDVFDSANVIAAALRGRTKPIFNDDDTDNGDIVVAINTKELSLPRGEWRWRMYYHHTSYGGGKTWAPAHILHLRDPTIVLYKAVYKALLNKGIDYKRTQMARLYLFPDENIPQHIRENICDQIRSVNPVHKSLDEIDAEKVKTFPKIFDYPEDYTLMDKKPSNLDRVIPAKFEDVIKSWRKMHSKGK